MMRVFIATAFCLGMACTAASSDNEIADGASDVNVAMAREEIARMNESQLRSLFGYLAECRGRSLAPLAAQACKSARSRYEIEFGGRSAAVDLAIKSAEEYLQTARLIGRLTTGDGASVPPGTVKIDTALQDAVRSSLQRLHP